jgi:hypothetical protein
MEASRPDAAGPPEVALSAAEAAFLRRFVRRHALSRAAGLWLLAAALLAIALDLWPARGPEPAAASGPGVAAADLEALRAEVAEVRTGLAEPSPRPAPAPETAAAVAELARRIEALAHEIVALRSRVESAPAPAPAGAPAAPAEVPGLAGLAERLYQLELRQSETESGRVEVEGQLLARLHGLELRQEEREREDATALGSVLERMGRLESSRDAAEARRLDGQSAILARLDALETRLAPLPAAPAPR